MYFTAEQESRIKEAAAQIEAKTGVQVVAAVVGKADAYPEAPWKAFALAASLATLVLMVQAVLDPPWIVPLHTALYAVVALGVGGAAALLTTLLPSFARWFLTAARRETEVDQYARALFLDRELFRTRKRIGILLLVSLFERKVVVLPDIGVAGRIGERALADVVRETTAQLTRGDRFAAISAGLAALEAALLDAGFCGTPDEPDELSEELVQEEGVQE